jgi:hypothetical protein
MIVDRLDSFKEAVAELEAIQAAMASLSKQDDSNWRRDFIDLRRRLQSQITQVSLAITRCLPLSRDDRLVRELKDALSRMRTAVALHQANWPAVSIDASSPEYLQSTSGVREANRDFIDLARKLLERGPSNPSSQSSGS